MNANGSQSAYTVLIADDNRDTVETLSALVRFEGHQVIEAHCGAQALKQAQQLHPGVLVLDIGMPGRSGYEVASQIRREPWGQHAIRILRVVPHGRQRTRDRGWIRLPPYQADRSRCAARTVSIHKRIAEASQPNPQPVGLSHLEGRGHI
jgi:CheY-like chemotaxis protein